MPDDITATDAIADEDAQNTRDGFAHADHVETAEQTREALQRWGSSSPGQNTLAPTGDSPASADEDRPAAE
jgi:hypothetical protein